MSYQIEISDNFKKEAKKLFKKYPSLYSEIAQLIEELKENPRMGTHLGAGLCWCFHQQNRYCLSQVDGQKTHQRRVCRKTNHC